MMVEAVACTCYSVLSRTLYTGADGNLEALAEHFTEENTGEVIEDGESSRAGALA